MRPSLIRLKLLAKWAARNTRANQPCGSVETREGRCIAFPNIYQHRVSPFELVDRTKPGHRKILALFLVHPNLWIPSSSSIPMQQAFLVQEGLKTSSLRTKLPAEILDMIVGHIPNMMSPEEARKYREELMDERTTFVSSHDSSYFHADFNLCEH